MGVTVIMAVGQGWAQVSVFSVAVNMLVGGCFLQMRQGQIEKRVYSVAESVVRRVWPAEVEKNSERIR